MLTTDHSPFTQFEALKMIRVDSRPKSAGDDGRAEISVMEGLQATSMPKKIKVGVLPGYQVSHVIQMPICNGKLEACLKVSERPIGACN